MADNIFKINQNGVLTGCSAPGPELIIPEGVTAIAERVFKKETSLQKIVFPSSLQRIRTEAFRGCANLKEVVFSTGPRIIEDSAFRETRLTAVVLPDGLTELGAHVFAACQCLTRAELPDSLQTMGADCFDSCAALADVKLPSGLTALPDWTFYNCTSLTELELPENLNDIGAAAFRCSGLRRIDFPNTVEKIGKMAFQDCFHLQAVRTPVKLKCLENRVFHSCGALRNITLSEGLERINQGAFYGCTALERLELPYSLNDISTSAFRDCRRLKEVIVPEGHPVFRILDGGLFAQNTGTMLLFFNEKTGNYTVPEGVKVLADHLFTRMKKLKTVVLPAGVTVIESHAFNSCPALRRVELPEGLTEIGSYAFSYCTALTDIRLPESLTALGAAVFEHCTALASMTVPAGVVSLEATFAGCSGLKEVRLLGENVQIGNSVFFPDSTAIITPKTPIGNFEPSQKAAAAAGFAQAVQEKMEIPENIRTEYMKYIRRQRKRLYGTALQHPVLLRLMLEEKILPQSDFSAVLETSTQNRRTECTAMLLEYQHKNLKPVDELARLERQLKKEERKLLCQPHLPSTAGES